MDTLLSLIGYLILLVVVLAALYVLGTYLLFAYDRRLSRHGYLSPGYEECGDLPHGGSAFLSLLYEVICTSLCIFLYPLKWRSHKSASRVDVVYHRPILLVHGFLHNQSGWTWLRRQLRMEKLGPVYSLNLDTSHRSVEELASDIQKRVEEIEQETGQRQLILVGHSMGGVVASYYAEHVAEVGRVTDLITLGSPLDGTRPAVMSGRAQSARQIYPNSDLLKELAKCRAENREIRYYHVASLFDALILPTQSAWSGVPEERLMILPSHGHMRLLFSKRVACQLVAWLKVVTPITESQPVAEPTLALNTPA